MGFAGINHQAIWGGEGKIAPLYEMKPIQAYWYTITGKTFNYTKIGNHFGTIDLGLQWKRKEWSYFIYRQNIYESGSLFKVINFTDGLNGLSIKRNKSRLAGTTYFQIRSILLEVVGTKDQTNSNPFSGISLLKKEITIITIYTRMDGHFMEGIWVRHWLEIKMTQNLIPIPAYRNLPIIIDFGPFILVQRHRG